MAQRACWAGQRKLESSLGISCGVGGDPNLGLGDQGEDMWILSINSRASIQIKYAMNLWG